MMQANGEASLGPSIPTEWSDTRGKHRILAELKQIEKEVQFLNEELEELKKIEKVSASLQELLNLVESRPDPLLQVTNGPIDPTWDQWFEGPQDKNKCSCCII